jgi:hypothetical protein
MTSYVLPILIIFTIGAAPALIFIFSIWKRYLRLTLVFLLILIILGAAASVFLLYGGGFFGVGLSCLTVPVAASSLIVLIGARAAFFRSSKEDKSRRRLYLMGIFLIPFLLVGPLLEEFLIIGACDAWNRRTGNTIARALEAYKQDHRTYPKDLEALVPTYIPVLPSARCFAPYQWSGGSDTYQRFHAMSTLWTDGEFRLHKCPREEVTLLTVPSVLFDFIQRYNLATGNWSRTSLLDGTCTFVR